jgi:4-hydroxybenzoate polyprenyltransferase
LPNENPPPQSFFAEIETVLHALSLYGAAGIAAFGWAMGWLLGLSAAHWLPLLFCAALVIYNADRLRRDPADILNVPARTAASARLRRASAVTLTLAALVLIGLPALRREWEILGFVLGGALISLGYSIPILGFRWKDIPFLKSLFAPAIITIAIFTLLFHPPISGAYWATTLIDVTHVRPWTRILLVLAPWAFFYLLFNMLLCDLRDREGDARCGIRSIPVVLGEKGTQRLLWALASGGQLCLCYLTQFRVDRVLAFVLISLLTGVWQLYLLHATRRPRSERFYEWAVEALLYLPALACGMIILLARIRH